MLRNRDLLRGLFLIAVALLFGLQAWNYPLGRLTRAGPGMFPLVVSAMLLLVGLVTVIRSGLVRGQAVQFSVRNVGLILGSLLVFTLLSRYVGMAVGIVALVFCATFTAPSYSVRRNALIAASLIAIAFLFQRLFGLDLRLF